MAIHCSDCSFECERLDDLIGHWFSMGGQIIPGEDGEPSKATLFHKFLFNMLAK